MNGQSRSLTSSKRSTSPPPAAAPAAKKKSFNRKSTRPSPSASTYIRDQYDSAAPQQQQYYRSYNEQEEEPIHHSYHRAKAHLHQHLTSKRVPSAFPWYSLFSIIFICIGVTVYEATVNSEASAAKSLFTVFAGLCCVTLFWGLFRLWRFVRSGPSNWDEILVRILYNTIDLYVCFLFVVAAVYMIFWVWGKETFWNGFPSANESLWRTLCRFLYAASLTVTSAGVALYQPSHAATEIVVGFAFWAGTIVSLLLLGLTGSVFITTITKYTDGGKNGKRSGDAKRAPPVLNQHLEEEITVVVEDPEQQTTDDIEQQMASSARRPLVQFGV